MWWVETRFQKPIILYRLEISKAKIQLAFECESWLLMWLITGSCICWIFKWRHILALCPGFPHSWHLSVLPISTIWIICSRGTSPGIEIAIWGVSIGISIGLIGRNSCWPIVGLIWLSYELVRLTMLVYRVGDVSNSSCLIIVSKSESLSNNSSIGIDCYLALIAVDLSWYSVPKPLRMKIIWSYSETGDWAKASSPTILLGSWNLKVFVNTLIALLDKCNSFLQRHDAWSGFASKHVA